MTRLQAIIFDVDGTLAETEELHRAAFNETFSQFGLGWAWSVDRYRDLLRVTGGKERIRHCARETGVGVTDARIAEMHAHKTACYTKSVAAGRCPLRPGVAAALDVAKANGLRLAIATTTSHANVDALLDATLGESGRGRFEVIVAGDDVPNKKPAPDIYLLALERLDLPASDCLAIEDSANGVAAARAASIEVWVTPSLYTAPETFEGAARILDDLSGFNQLIDGSGSARLVGEGQRSTAQLE